MNVLFKTCLDRTQLAPHRTLADYTNDTLLHGLHELGINVVDCPRLDHMYHEYQEDWAKRLHGRGFTLSRTLTDKADRCNVDKKLADKYFDLVLIGTHCTWSRDNVVSAVREVAQVYPPEKIAFLDGLDSSEEWFPEIQHLCKYFKREGREGLLPLGFSIPASKVVSEPPIKVKSFANSNPRSSEYIFDTEQSYYHDYQESYFGLTCKKGGWDCLRHYEILMNGCLPYFMDIEHCPTYALPYFPKQLCLKAKTLDGIDFQNRRLAFINKVFPTCDYFNLVREALEYTREHLTTKVSAKRLLEIMAT